MIIDEIRLIFVVVEREEETRVLHLLITCTTYVLRLNDERVPLRL